MKLQIALSIALAASMLPGRAQTTDQTQIASPGSNGNTETSAKGVFSRRWKGMLVDANCVPSGGEMVAGGITSPDMQSSRTRTEESGSADRISNPQAGEAAVRGRDSKPNTQGTAEADRPAETSKSGAPESNPDLAATTNKTAAPPQSARSTPSTPAQWRNCPATAATTSFGLLLPDGKMLRFDAKGNSLAASRMKTGGKNTRVAAGGPTQVTIRGTALGEILQVESIR